MIIGSTSFPSMQGIRAFLAVAETGSFTRAAAALGVTQTAVSHQIGQFESWLGAPVFERSSRSVTLTPLGRGLIDPVGNAVGQLHATLVEARRGTGTSSRRITVSATPEFGTQWLAPRLETFLQARPDISVSVTLEYRRANVVGGEVDLAIWLGSGGAGVEAERLMLEEEFVVSSPALSRHLPKRHGLLAAPILNYAGARHTVLDWRRWMSQLWGADIDATFDKPAGSIDFEAGPLFDDFAAMIAACREGAGFALVRSSLVADDLSAGRLVRCFVESLPSDLHYHLVTLPVRRLRPELAEFRQWLVDAAK